MPFPNQLKSGTDAERDVISPMFLPYTLTLPVPDSVRATTLSSPFPSASSYHSIRSHYSLSLSLKKEERHQRIKISSY
jgi:hypothetical protein